MKVFSTNQSGCGFLTIGWILVGFFYPVFCQLERQCSMMMAEIVASNPWSLAMNVNFSIARWTKQINVVLANIWEWFCFLWKVKKKTGDFTCSWLSWAFTLQPFSNSEAICRIFSSLMALNRARAFWELGDGSLWKSMILSDITKTAHTCRKICVLPFESLAKFLDEAIEIGEFAHFCCIHRVYVGCGKSDLHTASLCGPCVVVQLLCNNNYW